MLAVGLGDLAAFEQLVLRYQANAWRVAYRLTGDSTEAEDLAQGAFLRLLDAAPRYKPTAKFRTYFYRILTRLCFDYNRKRRPVPTESLPDMPGKSLSPLQQASQVDRNVQIQAALDNLPDDYRMAIVLRYFEGLNGTEIAEAMGRSVKAVERLLARAREALEPQLKGLIGNL